MNSTEPIEPTGVKTPAEKTRPTRAQVVTWCMWDAGSAAVNAVATTFVFSVYLASGAFGPKDHASSMIANAMLIAGIIVALTAPITGQRSDRSGHATRWLGIFSLITVAAIAAMFFVEPSPSHLLLGVTLLAVMTVFFEFASVNYYAMLNRVSTPSTIGRISGIGWASGYFGGIILLILLKYGFIDENNLVGIDTANGMGVRTAMAVAALWALVFFVPVLFTVRGRAHPDFLPEENVARESLIESYRKLFQTVRNLYQHAPKTLYFLIASAIFRDGLTGVFTFGGIIAAGTFGMTDAQIIIYAILANVIAGISTMIIGYFDDWLGPKKVMVISLGILVAVCLLIFLLHDRGPIVMWTVGLFMTMWVGPAQSASRSFLARRIPPGHEGEVFGLYQTTGRAATPLAPAFFSLFIAIGGWIYPGAKSVQYFGILGIGVVLVVGLALLLPIKEDEAHLNHL